MRIRRTAVAALVFAVVACAISPAGAVTGNDNFNNAIPIAFATDAGLDFTGATLEAGEPQPSSLAIAGAGGCWQTQDTVWLRFVPQTSLPIVASTAGFGRARPDTIVAVYTGTAINNLALVGCDDDVQGYDRDGDRRLTSSASFFAIAGETYWIQVGRRFGGETGTIRLSAGFGETSADADRVYTHPSAAGPYTTHDVDVRATPNGAVTASHCERHHFSEQVTCRDVAR